MVLHQLISPGNVPRRVLQSRMSRAQPAWQQSKQLHDQPRAEGYFSAMYCRQHLVGDPRSMLLLRILVDNGSINSTHWLLSRLLQCR